MMLIRSLARAGRDGHKSRSHLAVVRATTRTASKAADYCARMPQTPFDPIAAPGEEEVADHSFMNSTEVTEFFAKHEVTKAERLAMLETLQDGRVKTVAEAYALARAS